MVKSNKIFKLLYFLSVSMGASALNFLVQIIGARNLDLKDYGEFNTYVTFLNLISPLLGMGLANLWIREYSKSDDIGNKNLRGSLIFFIITLFLIFFLQIAYSAFDVNNYLAFSILCTFVWAQAATELVNSFNLINNNMGKYIFWRLCTPILRIFIILIFIYFTGLNILTISVAYFISSIPVVIKLCKDIYDRKELLKKSEITTLIVFKESWFFGITAFLYMLYFQSNILVISKFMSYQDVAIYSSALTIVSIALMIPPMIFQKFYAFDINHWFFHDRKKFIVFFKKSLIKMSFSGLVLTLLFIFLSTQLIQLIYGNRYEDSVNILNILSICIFSTFLSSSCSFVFINKRELFIKTNIMILASFLNLILSCLVIKEYGIIGVAWVTVFCYLFVAVCFLSYSLKIVLGKGFLK
ncbi:lipopolysaccharide biosynthesis protein [Acinetobacter baumannii]|uniref:lipopolysaccharide biosynthesis protein n=1 Tax=Acinetobacter baumannii TaxID=470 RepID=UPI0013EEE096|nr:oligosaccharide flippase family protein [Acinetobacter baumannii]